MTDVVAVDRLELTFAPRAWPFAERRRAEIDRHFAAVRRDLPALWNGRVLLLDRHELAGRVLRGRYFETDFASFLAWRDWGFPDAGVKNCFAQGALRSADGAFLLGVMGPQTANAGRIYFPSGTPDPTDVVGDAVDLAGSVRREVAEETGLLPHDYASESGWHAVLDGPRLALIKVLDVPADASSLCAKVRAHLERQAHPELSDVRTVREPADLDPMMPSFVTAFLDHVWAAEAS